MANQYAILDLGISANVAKPVALALAVFGGISAPGTTVDNSTRATGQSASGVPHSAGLAMQASGADAQDDATSASPAASSSISAITMPAPKAVAGIFDPVRQVPAGPSRRSLVRQPLAFDSNFADFPDPVAQAGVVEQVVRAEAAPAAIPIAKVEGEEVPAVAEQITPPVELASDPALKINDLTAFDPAPRSAESLAQPVQEARIARTPVAPAIAFVAVPVVQPVAAATGEPRSLVEQVPAKPPIAEPKAAASPAPALKSKPLSKQAAPSLARVSGVEAIDYSIGRKPQVEVASASRAGLKSAKTPASNGMASYRLGNDVIEFALPARLNGENVGTIPLRVTRDDRLWVRLGDLLGMVRGKMDPAQFETLSSSTAANEYLDFESVRKAGIALKYDAARNRIDLGQM